MCKFSVACNHFYKQDDETQKEVSFFDISYWTRLARGLQRITARGPGLRVVGRLKQDRWTDTDSKDGESGAGEGQAEAADGQAQQKAELREAASF